MADLKYCSHVLISEDTQDLWQNLYSSQSYNTFYSVYSKFDLDNYDGKECSLDLITLKIINYKGSLDIGFYQDSDSQNPYHKGYILRKESFKNIPNGHKHDHYYVLQIFTCARVGNPKSRFEIQIDKSELADLKISDGQLLFVERVILSFDGKSSDFINGLPDSSVQSFYESSMKSRGVFDGEFFYRNGFLKAKRKDTDASLLKNTFNPETGVLNGVGTLLDGNPSCHNRVNFFRFK